MNLQKEQDSNRHGSDWILVICKYWNWNWYWDWKYYFFLTKSGEIVWVTASTTLPDLFTRDHVTNVKPYIFTSAICNTYGCQTWLRSNLRWGESNFQSHATFWLYSHVTNEKNLYLNFHNLWLKVPPPKSFELLKRWSHDK